MELLVDICIALVLLLAAVSGTKRGAVLIGLEFICFVLATLVAFWLYRPLGSVVQTFGLQKPVANLVGFVVLWVLVEVGSALAIRFTVLKRLNHDIQLSQANQIGGSFLNIVKFAFLIGLALIVVAALPVRQTDKAFITNSFLGKELLGATTQIQDWLGGGIGRDLGDSLNFFTISSEAESTERIELGFTATGTVDQAAEDSMLTLVNQERTSRGLPALEINREAQVVARTYALRMFNEGYFSHLDPDGHNPFQRLQAAGVHFYSAGENLALAPTLQQAHDGLMKSPGHRANILSTNFGKVGIGIIHNPKYGLMIAQEFTN